MLNIVLYQPEIPQNTGNIGRTAYLTNSKLHLIKPLGFSLTDRAVKKAGLDYWQNIDLQIHNSFEDFLIELGDKPLVVSTTKARNIYSDYNYNENSFILFGQESSGLPKEIINLTQSIPVRVPMLEDSTRSLNVANTVSVVVYEALRQLDYPKLK